jgi:hypothetical protein
VGKLAAPHLGVVTADVAGGRLGDSGAGDGGSYNRTDVRPLLDGRPFKN